MSAKQVWMGHAGHFICGNDCQFHLNTYVNGVIVSTLGELKDSRKEGFQPLGFSPDSLYESMVFTAVKTESGDECCPYRQSSGRELEGCRYATAGEAAKGHAKLIAKYARKKK
jgi:hypothetical protein